MKYLFPLLLSVLSLSGCVVVPATNADMGGSSWSLSDTPSNSSQLQGSTQVLTFSLAPNSTACVLTRMPEGEIGYVTAADNRVTVTQQRRDILATCKAPGYLDKVVALPSTGSVSGLIPGRLPYPSRITIGLELAPQVSTPTPTPVPNAALANPSPSTATNTANNNAPAANTTQVSRFEAFKQALRQRRMEHNAAPTPASGSYSVEGLRNLTATQIAAIAPKDLATFNAEQLSLLTTQQIQGITAIQVDVFNVHQVRSFREKITALNPTAWASLDTLQIQAIEPTHFAKLNADQLSKFTAEQCKWVNPAQTRALDATQAQALGAACPRKAAVAKPVIAPTPATPTATTPAPTAPTASAPAAPSTSAPVSRRNWPRAATVVTPPAQSASAATKPSTTDTQASDQAQTPSQPAQNQESKRGARR